MSWISVKTIENDTRTRKNWELKPQRDEQSDGKHFRVYDPFTIRRAIVPLFELFPNGTLQGLGTAFGLSSSGLFLTADHVICSYREGSKLIEKKGKSLEFETTEYKRLVAYLSPGMVFGTPNIPTSFFPQIVSAHSPIKEGDDPMREMSGEPNFRLADLSVLKSEKLTMDLHTLRCQTCPSKVNVGDQVVAIGFPELRMIRGSAHEVSQILQESMFASYGRVTALLPEGRDRANQTPVFEVETHWPSGMSGGPVLSSNGEVVGIVSRSLEATKEEPGLGWATWLAFMPELNSLLRDIE